MEPPISLTISPVSQQIDPVAMDDQPQSTSVSYLDGCDIDDFDPALGAAFGDFSEEELFDLFKDDITSHTLEQEEQHPQYPQQEQWDGPGEPEEGGEEKFVQQPQRVQHEQGILHIPTAESSTKPHFPTQSLDLDDSNSIEESLSISTTSTCTRHGGNAYEKAPARNTSCTTWSTTSASEESDDGSISICTAPIVISNNGKERQSKPSTSTRVVTDYDPDQEEKITKPLTVNSGAGTPILPFTFAPAFGPLGGNNPIATAAISSLPSIGELAYAAATGWKRLRSPETNADGGQTSGPQDSGQRKLLSSSTRNGQTNSRTNKRAKKEERLMKNREAANRSRIKRKEVLNELENRAETLSKNLASSREENDNLKEEIASLREQNSFLRGMLSATGITKELPPVLPTSTNQQRQQNGSGGGGGGRVATGANAVVGAIGTAIAVVSCVALSATGYDMENGSHDDSGVAQTAGRRTLMSNDDFGPIPGGDFSVSWFGAGVRYLTQREVIQLIGIVVVLAVVFSLLFFLAREAYDMTVRRVNGGGRRTSVMKKAFATKSRRSGPWWCMINFRGSKIQ